MKRLAFAAVAGLFLIGLLPAQQIKEMEFKNQAIVDILLALAEMSGKSIVPDETVTGNASYYFNETDFETALKIFLATYKMYYWKDGSIFYVSRVRCVWSKDAGLAAIDAEDVELRLDRRGSLPRHRQNDSLRHASRGRISLSTWRMRSRPRSWK